MALKNKSEQYLISDYYKPQEQKPGIIENTGQSTAEVRIYQGSVYTGLIL